MKNFCIFIRFEIDLDPLRHYTVPRKDVCIEGVAER